MQLPATTQPTCSLILKPPPTVAVFVALLRMTCTVYSSITNITMAILLNPSTYCPSELPYPYPCTLCNKYFHSSDELEAHTANHTTHSPSHLYSRHSSTSNDDSQVIPQVDGNDSIMTDLSDNAPANDNSEDFSYSYALNPQNQARRLLSAAQSNPFTVTFNN